MTEPRKSKCRSCGADIYWATTEKGKSMPVNVEREMDGNISLFLHRPTGELTAMVHKPGGGPWEDRYVSHFATCPQAQQHRRGK